MFFFACIVPCIYIEVPTDLWIFRWEQHNQLMKFKNCNNDTIMIAHLIWLYEGVLWYCCMRTRVFCSLRSCNKYLLWCLFNLADCCAFSRCKKYFSNTRAIALGLKRYFLHLGNTQKFYRVKRCYLGYFGHDPCK